MGKLRQSLRTPARRLILVLAVLAGMLGALSVRQELAGGEKRMDDEKPVCGSTACDWPTDDAALRRVLTPEQYRIVRENGTETPFHNAFWDHHAEGLYVDVVSGEPLFSSRDKFDSGTGWPSFTRPLDSGAVVERSDTSGGMTRIEVRSAQANSHLGHLFDDGPAPTGRRYCINSAALRFVPVDALAANGYGALLPQFGCSADTAANVAIFGAGCFWGTEAYFRRVPGVLTTAVGYAGGSVPAPSYEQVCSKQTGHAEVVRLTFDPTVISYDQLVRHFLRLHDPTALNRQGNDIGTQYRSLIVATTAEQERVARAALQRAAARYPRPLVTEINRADLFYPAEEYHQDYLGRNPGGYCHVDLALAAQPLD